HRRRLAARLGHRPVAGRGRGLRRLRERLHAARRSPRPVAGLSFLAADPRFLRRISCVSELRIGQAADLLGVIAGTVRRWADEGRLATTRTEGGQRLVDGAALAAFAAEQEAAPEPGAIVSESARNRLTGIVTRVVKDKVAAQVEMRAGPHRMVSLMT